MFQWSLKAMARMPHLDASIAIWIISCERCTKSRKRVNMTIDTALKELVFDPRIDLQHLRVVFQHLVEVVLGLSSRTRATVKVLPTINSSAAFASAAKSHISISPPVNIFSAKFCRNGQNCGTPHSAELEV